jgi:hypothetical protein
MGDVREKKIKVGLCLSLCTRGRKSGEGWEWSRFR